MIRFTCMYCQAELSAPEDQAGHPSKCSTCGRTMRVPTGAKAGSPPLTSSMQVRERVEVEEIPLADEPSWTGRAESEAARTSVSSEAPRGRVMPRDEGGDEVDRSEVPLAEEPSEKKGPTPAEEPSTVTPGGLVVTTSGEVTGISFQSAKILDPIEIETIGEELCALVDGGACRRFFLDFGNVKYLSSQMIGVLMKVQKKVTAGKGRLLLCAVSPELQKLFQIVKLEKLLPIVPDRQAAKGVLSLP